ncbi:MAG: hypothetical protein LBJ78_03125 [Puniceicoccales bacterium]|nr:hypothetical protein [Puniceicoccales bacterium]
MRINPEPATDVSTAAQRSSARASLGAQQGDQPPRTVTLGKAGLLRQHLQNIGNQNELAQVDQAIQTYCDQAAQCPTAFKPDGQFQGFVNGYVGGAKEADAKFAINKAYRDYKACGLAAASAQEIQQGINKFTKGITDYLNNKFTSHSLNPLTANKNDLTRDNLNSVKDSFNLYLYGALEAYPGLFTEEEKKALQTHIVGGSLDLIADINRTADPKITVAQAGELIKENLDKILYQQFRDQQMITGSDHGIHHIVMGNIKNSLAVLDQCTEVTSREKLMVLQTMVDHDLGYTTYAAQADFGAAKDHPLASRAYVESNINSIFTDDEKEFIRSSILTHSYPSDLGKPLDFTKNKAQSLRNVVAVVDAMGTTQDTKLPSVFRQPAIQAQLFALGIEKLRSDVTLEPTKKQLESLPKPPGGSQMQQKQRAVLENNINTENMRLQQRANECKTAMVAILDGDQNMSDLLKARYKQAIAVDFDTFSAANIMPQFAGTLQEAKAVPQKPVGSGQYKIAITMEVSLAEKFAQSIAGRVDPSVRDRFKAFNKMAEDITKGMKDSSNKEIKSSLGEAIDQALYIDGDPQKPKETCEVSTNLVNFTFTRAPNDTNELQKVKPHQTKSST